MGTLYYFVRRDKDDEVFALNKVGGYLAFDALEAHSDPPGKPLPPREEFLARYVRPQAKEFGARVADRLYRWAGDSPIWFTSEHAWDVYEDLHPGLSYDEQKAKITGSAHDSDYEADGVTYKPGSAW